MLSSVNLETVVLEGCVCLLLSNNCVVLMRQEAGKQREGKAGNKQKETPL